MQRAELGGKTRAAGGASRANGAASAAAGSPLLAARAAARAAALAVALVFAGAHLVMPTRARAHAQGAIGNAASEKEEALIARAFARLTLEQKLGQLLIIGFSGTESSPFLQRWVGERNVGGVALFARNLKHHGQTAALTASIAELGREGIVPFIAVDQEGGPVVRLRERVSLLPSNMALGAADSELLAYLAGRASAVDLRGLGFNMNLAPVLDVNSNPNNPVINVRSFGENPQRVAALGEAFVRGQQAGGVCSVAKHFPGHGDTATDSHFALPLIHADWARLQAVEMPPFRAAIGAGIDAVMTAHIALPQIPHAGNEPATLSYPIVTGLLRQALHYDGIVVTDGLEMQGVAQRYGIGPAAVRAIHAGADMPMVLWSDEACESAYATLLAAARADERFARRVDVSVRRILRVKARRGLLRASTVPEELDAAPQTEAPASQGLNALHEALMQRVAENALTLLGNEANVVPLPQQMAGWVLLAPPGPLLEAGYAHGARVVAVPLAANRHQRALLREDIKEQCAAAAGVIAAVANPSQLDFAAEAHEAAPQAPYVFVALGSPYVARTATGAAASLLTYSALPVSERAAIRALWGQVTPSAPAPVSVQEPSLAWPEDAQTPDDAASPVNAVP